MKRKPAASRPPTPIVTPSADQDQFMAPAPGRAAADETASSPEDKGDPSQQRASAIHADRFLPSGLMTLVPTNTVPREEDRVIRRVRPSDPIFFKQTPMAQALALYEWASENPYAKLPPLTAGGPGGGQSFFDKLINTANLFNPWALSPAFAQRDKDYAPSVLVRTGSRPKMLHPAGPVALGEFVPNPRVAGKYTGLWAEKGPVLVRASLASPAGGAFTPGLAFMFPIQDQNPATILAVHDQAGQPTRDFFARPLSNVGKNPTSAFLKFLNFTTTLMGISDPIRLPLDRLANFRPDGSKVTDTGPPKGPKVVSIEAPSGVKVYTRTNQEFNQQLPRIPPGTKISELWDVQPNGAETLVGTVTLVRRFVNSEVADYSLRFPHYFFPTWVTDLWDRLKSPFDSRR